MDDEADVGFVDAHSEGDGGANDLDFVADEELLVLVSFFGGKAGVVGAGGDSVGLEAGGDGFGGFAALAIDDAGFAAAFVDEGEDLGEGAAGFWRDAVGEIGAVETADVDGGIAHPEMFYDIFADAGGGGGGERHEGDVGEDFAEGGELAVFGAEIVSPFGDAVGFVDGDEADVPAGEGLLEVVEHGAFGGDVEEAEFSGFEAGKAVAGFFGGEGGVEESGGDSGGLESVDLIFHERDQGRNDESEAGVDEGGKLVAEGFSAAGGEESEDVAAGEEIGDDFALERAEGVEAEVLFEEGEELGVGHGCEGADLGVKWMRDVIKRSWVADGKLFLGRLTVV